MTRTILVLLLAGFLLVSAGANAVLFQQAAANKGDADSYRDRLRAAQQSERPTLEARIAELNREVQQLRAAQPGTRTPAAPVPTVSTPVPSGSSSAPDRVVLTRIEEQVERLRGLKSKGEVPLQFLNQTALKRYFVEYFERDYLPHEREADQKLLSVLGLLRPSENLVQILLDLLQEQVIGIYNEDEKTMYVIGETGRFGPLEQSTFAHEYVHALQDQYWNLGRLAPKHPENADRSLAIHAVLEGDAVLLQRLWEAENLTPEQIQRMFESVGDTSRLDSAPAFVRAELLFPYTSGFTFARTAHQAAGFKYSGIDALLADPPESTEQILHPEKYRAREAPVAVAIPDLAPAMGAGWRMIATNVFGELDTRSLLEQYGEPRVAARASTGWGGDRWQLLEKEGRPALVWRTSWDTENDAREFFDAYAQGLRTRFAGARQEEGSPTRHALTWTTAATELRLNGSDVLAVIGLDRPSAEALATAVGGF